MSNEEWATRASVQLRERERVCVAVRGALRPLVDGMHETDIEIVAHIILGGDAQTLLELQGQRVREWGGECIALV